MVDSMPMASDLKPVITVTVAYVVLYYIFLYLQSGSKFYLYFKALSKDPKASYAKVKYGNTELLARTTDRTAGNMIEQSIPFLISLWLCAIFDSPDYAAKLGWFWLAFRAIYPIAFYNGFWVLASTVPGYMLIVMLLYPVVVGIRS